MIRRFMNWIGLMRTTREEPEVLIVGDGVRVPREMLMRVHAQESIDVFSDPAKMERAQFVPPTPRQRSPHFVPMRIVPNRTNPFVNAAALCRTLNEFYSRRPRPWRPKANSPKEMRVAMKARKSKRASRPVSLEVASRAFQ